MTRPVRFAMVTTFYPPSSFGGDAIAIQRHARALVRRGHEVTVIHDVDVYRALADGPVGPAPVAEPDGVRVIELESRLGVISPILTHQFGRPVVHGKRIRRILDDGEFDVIHLNNVSLVGGPGVLSAGDGVRVYEAHEHWLVCPSHVLWRHNREVCTSRECLRCVIRHRRIPQLWRHMGGLTRALEHVDVFVAKSEFSRRKHEEFGFPRPMEVLPYFLDDLEAGPDSHAGQARANEAHASQAGDGARGLHERPYFLFAGRLEKIKGLDDVLPVFREYGDADLLIAGDGTYEATLRRLAADSPRIRFLGRLSSEELRRYYEGAIALIVPSVCYETFGIIIIESFRQGTPVLARDIGPFPEIIKACGGGELFRDVAGLAAAMRRLQEDASRRKSMSTAALQGFASLWSESAVIPRYLDLVEQAARARGRTELAETLAASRSESASGAAVPRAAEA
jgi:glycosyltransferase involved in cell wall biosynthesis